MYLSNSLLLIGLLFTVSPISAQPVRHTGLHSLHQHHAHRHHRSWYNLAHAISQLQKPIQDANLEAALPSKLNLVNTPSSEHCKGDAGNSSGNDT